MKRPVTFAMFFLALATAACQPAPEEDSGKYLGGGVTVRCDHGRAVYTYSDYKKGGIAVVENAPECAQ